LDTRDRDLLGGARTGAPQMAAGESDDTEMIVGGNSVSPLAAGDPDYRACEKSSGDSAIAACDRAIASGKFKRQSLSYLYNDRGFLLMQKGAIEAALADLNKAIETYPSNFYAYWNRGAIYAAKRDLARAQEDLGMALALNPDEHSSAKIREALNAVSASAAETAQPQAPDPSVITDPSQFWGRTTRIPRQLCRAEAASTRSPVLQPIRCRHRHHSRRRRCPPRRPWTPCPTGLSRATSGS
jgi:hypothetical protein